MKLTLSYPLYRRKDPSNRDAAVGYLNDGDTIEITEVVEGKPIDANSTWYKATDGLFYWSGGIDNNEFILPGLDFMKLSPEEQYELTAAAMEYYFDILKGKVPGFTGMSVSFKNVDDNYLDFYALVIQVEQKKLVNSPVPGFLSYKGYSIPTDLVIASQTLPADIGDSISRKHIFSDGSAGFIAKSNHGEAMVMVTNYHVACIDLMLLSPRKLAIGQDEILDKPEVVMPANGVEGSAVIGQVIAGRLDRFNDVALIQLEKNSLLTNKIRFIGKIKGIRSIDSIKQNFRPGVITVQMFGAKSKFKTGLIESFNARQAISYLDGDFDHVLKGLIQVSRMSQPGDSGSAVVDLDNRLIGIMVAADSKFSYILPVENILGNFNLNQLQ